MKGERKTQTLIKEAQALIKEGLWSLSSIVELIITVINGGVRGWKSERSEGRGGRAAPRWTARIAHQGLADRVIQSPHPHLSRHPRVRILKP